MCKTLGAAEAMGKNKDKDFEAKSDHRHTAVPSTPSSAYYDANDEQYECITYQAPVSLFLSSFISTLGCRLYLDVYFLGLNSIGGGSGMNRTLQFAIRQTAIGHSRILNGFCVTFNLFNVRR